MRWLPFSLGYLYAFLTLAAVWWRGPWLFVPPILSFVVLPILDIVVVPSTWNPPPEAERDLQHGLGFRFLTWAWVPVGVGVTIYALAIASHGDWMWSERLWLAFGVGLMNAVVGIVYAHELVHQANRFEQFLGEMLLALVSYTHFRVEHVFGHHRYIGTPRDPATARLGESFYRFFVRSVTLQYRSAWQLEAERLQRSQRTPYGIGNRMWWYLGATLAIVTTLFATLGAVAVVLFLFQSVVAFASLELINYVEHYGLMRREAGGKYERVAPLHSWNSPHRITNWFLINLGRHSDHHASASRRWQILRTFDESDAPQLPAGYAAMYVLALIPPAWSAVMDERAVQRTSLRGVRQS